LTLGLITKPTTYCPASGITQDIGGFKRTVELFVKFRRIPILFVRYSKQYWQFTLFSLVLISIGTIVLVSQGTGQNNATIVSAVIAVTPPTLYYINKEFLTKPAVFFSQTDTREVEIAPMQLPKNQLQEFNGLNISVGGEPAEIRNVEDDSAELIVENEKQG